MKIRTQLVVLLSLLILIFSFTFFGIRNADKQQMVFLFENATAGKRDVFNKLLTLQGRAAKTLTFDYTYWDEMANFLETKDKVWAQEMMGGALSSYQVDAIWIYDTAFSLVYSIEAPGKETFKEIPLPREAMGRLFAGKPLADFFLNTPKGLLEIHGGSIHPSNDAARKTAPRGYFFDGKLWSPEYIHELSELTGSRLWVSAISSPKVPSNTLDTETGTVSFSEILYGSEGQPVALLTAQFVSEEIHNFNHSSRRYLVLFLIFSAGIIGIVAFFAFGMIGIPLKSIEEALKTGNGERLASLQKNKTEFGDMARLILAFFKQKNDLTDEVNRRKQTELSLRAAEDRYRDLVEGTDDLITIVDKDGRFVYVNHASEKIFGLKPEDCIGLLAFDFVHPEDKERTERDFKSWVRERKSAVTYQNRQVRKDGRVFDMLWNINLHLDEAGEVVLANNFARDISEQKRVEAALRGSEEYLARIIDSVADPIFVKDREHRWVHFNKTFLEFMGHSGEEIRGRSDYDFFPKSEADVFWAKDEEVFCSGRENVNEEFFTDGKGVQRTISTKKAFYRDPAGKEFVVGVIRDITRQKQMEAELVESRKRLEAFFSSSNEGVIFHEVVMDSAGQPVDYRLLDVNPAFEQITGIPKAKAVGRLLPSSMAPEIRPCSLSTLKWCGPGSPSVSKLFLNP